MMMRTGTNATAHVAAIRRDLDTCLLTNDELLSDPALWRDLVNPFPVWDGHRHTH